MAHVIADRVKETSTTTGTGALTLGGAASGFVTFASRCSVGDSVFYAVAHQSANEWECGRGLYSAANQLTRVDVFAGTNGTSAVNFSAGTKDVFITAPAKCSPFVRERVTTDRTYYVDKTGNDNNSGLSSGTGAFLTIQKAVDTICDTLHIASGSITVSIGAGTYSEALLLRPFSCEGAKRVIIDGGGSGVAITPPSSGTIDAAGRGANYELTGFTMPGVSCTEGASIVVGEVSFVGAQYVFNMRADRPGSLIVVNGPVTVSGNSGAHVSATNGAIVQCGNELTLTGVPSFDFYFAYAAYGGMVFADGMEISGTATGQRYSVEAAGVIVAGENDPLPGSIAGTTATGGAYHT